MTKLDKLKSEWLKDPAVKQEYDALADEFTIAEAVIRARVEAGLTQEQVAEKMQTSQSYIAKLESGRISPSMKALQRFAVATGSRLRIHFD